MPRPVIWGDDVAGPRAAVVALDAVGMARFIPQSKALCSLGISVTINVTGGDVSEVPPSCDTAETQVEQAQGR